MPILELNNYDKFWQVAMLFKPNRYRPIKSTVAMGLVGLLTSCGSSTALESFVSPDPKLFDESSSELSQESKIQSPGNSSDVLVSGNSQNTAKQINTDKKKSTDQDNTILSNSHEDLDLPTNLLNSLPIYPQAKLQESKIDNNQVSGILIWNSNDNQKSIAEYYKAELAANGWTVIKPFNFSSKQQPAKAIALKKEVRIDLTLVNTVDSNQKDQKTKLSITYRPIEQQLAETDISQTINSTETKKKTEKSQPDQKILAKDDLGQPEIPNTKDTLKPNPELSLPNEQDLQVFNSSGVDFTDLNQVPEQLRQPLELVAALDILTPYTGNNSVEISRFAPNQVITRAEYARWLVAANNRYFADDSGKKIYLVTDLSQPAFQDVKPSNPDFKAIQSLAEVGLVPSRLTEDSTSLLFKPSAPLKREDLLTWKVPLDMRQALPKASIQAIQESWGFQDAAEIESSATRALYADYQNGDLSNVRRIFGYTTLFQPKKTVTRAEAAASLWYFGFQGDGVTAKEILKAESDKQN